MTWKLLYVMRTALACAGLVSLLALSACHTADPDPEVLECLSDNDCPPACTCVDRVSVAACWLETTDTANDRIRCAGTCDAETECPEGTECRRETTEQPLPSTTVRFSCGPDPGTGGMGGVGGTGGTAGSGGSGGAGGSGGGPCSTPLPTGTGFFVDVYATFDDTSPGAVSFADDGTLFVANVGLLGVPSPEQSLPILKIDAAATMIVDSTDKVNDPDVLIVDNVGVVASSGNVLVGGLLGVPVNGRSVGRLTELNASGTTVDTAESDPCIYNVSAMLLAQDNSLLLGNFVLADDPIDDDVPAVCKVTKDLGMGWVLAAEFIMPLIHPISGLAQAPRANNIDGDLFLSRTVQRKADGVLRKDEVDRYDSTGTLESGNLAEGIVLGYGPEGSEFDGVLILRSNGNLDLVNPVSSLGSTLLTGVEDDVGNSAAFYPNSGAAVLYISQWEQRRILRVSKGLLDATELGCSN